MDISKTTAIGGHYRDRNTPINWDVTLFAKVVFLDKTNPSANPQLYQLVDSALADRPPDLIKSQTFSFNDDAFTHIGEVSEIDKKKKQILLSNRNTVSYTYLVVVSGNKSHFNFQGHEFSAGLQALVEALKMQDKNPFKISLGKKSSPQEKKNNDTFFSKGKPIETNCPIPSTITASLPKLEADPNTLHKRLYEVQL